MKVIFFGLGSIGQRHMRLLREAYPKTNIVAFRSYLGQEPVDIDVPTVNSWDEVASFEPQIAFITNPSNLHVKTALECARRGINLFIEKPLSIYGEELDELLQTIDKKNLTAYVAYCMRFHPAIQNLKKLLMEKNILHARIKCSSYFPDWRPNQDHLKSYTADQRQSGGIVFELSHEVDYAAYLFGKIESVSGVRGKRSNVTVDADDFADLLLTQPRCPCNIHLNLFSRKLQRVIEVDTDDLHIRADLVDSKIEVTKPDGSIATTDYQMERDDMFSDQLSYFISNLDNNRLDNNLFEAAALFQKLAAFREASQ